MMQDLIVSAADWQREQAALTRLRHRVFVEEQKVPSSIEMDGRDPDCWHVKAQIGNKIIGTGRLLPNGFIGRMCVLKDYRNQRIGAQMLDALVRQAQIDGHPVASLNAQTDAIPFYLKFGFNIDSEEFTEAGILHRRMVMPFNE